MLLSSVNVGKLCEELTDYSFAVSLESIELVRKMLFANCEDTGENGDVIMVFGSPSCLRHRSPKGFSSSLISARRIFCSREERKFPKRVAQRLKICGLRCADSECITVK